MVLNKNYILKKINQHYTFKNQHIDQYATHASVKVTTNTFVFISDLAQYTIYQKTSEQNGVITNNQLQVDIRLALSIIKQIAMQTKLEGPSAEQLVLLSQCRIIDVSLNNMREQNVAQYIFKRIAQVEQFLQSKNELLASAFSYYWDRLQSNRYYSKSAHPFSCCANRLNDNFITAFNNFYEFLTKPKHDYWGAYWKKQTIPVEGINVSDLIQKAKQTGKTYKKGKIQSSYWMRKGNKIEYEYVLIDDRGSTKSYKKVAIKHDNRKLRQNERKITQQILKDQKADEPLPYKPNKWWD